MIDNKNSIEHENIQDNNSIDKKIEIWENKILQNISNEYWIGHNNLEKLATFKTSKWIEWLKNEINIQNIDSLKEISDNKLENIIDAINKYQEEIKNDAKNKLAELKNDTNSIEKNTNTTFTLSKLSEESKEKYINNPKTNIDNIVWWAIWLVSSTEKIITTTYDLAKWVINLPRDLYNLATKKAKYDKEI